MQCGRNPVFVQAYLSATSLFGTGASSVATFPIDSRERLNPWSAKRRNDINGKLYPFESSVISTMQPIKPSEPFHESSFSMGNSLASKLGSETISRTNSELSQPFLWRRDSIDNSVAKPLKGTNSVGQWPLGATYSSVEP